MQVKAVVIEEQVFAPSAHFEHYYYIKYINIWLYKEVFYMCRVFEISFITFLNYIKLTMFSMSIITGRTNSGCFVFWFSQCWVDYVETVLALGCKSTIHTLNEMVIFSNAIGTFYFDTVNVGWVMAYNTLCEISCWRAVSCWGWASSTIFLFK